MPRRVVVVGAGFAGLAAASTLARRGAEVVVFEARDRVGGRVHSRELEGVGVVELGAEFILPGHEMIGRFAAEQGLELYEKGTLYGDREPRGGPPVTRTEIAEALARAAAAARDDEPLPATLVRVGAGEGARAAVVARIEVSTAYPADDQPSAILGDGGAGFGGFPSHGIAGGNQQLALSIAGDLGEALHLSTPVERIALTAHGVTVAVSGAQLEADAAVIAVPATLLPRIAFEPPLPEWKLEAVDAVGHGHASKLFLPLARPAPPSATLSVPGRFWTYTQLSPAGGPLPVACSFAGSPAAVERLDLETWPDAVRALRPDLEFEPEAQPVLSTWADDPWALAAYSARSLAHPPDDAALAAPAGPLHFAGEYTAGEFHALMEGALRSGVRAAGEALGPS